MATGSMICKPSGTEPVLGLGDCQRWRSWEGAGGGLGAGGPALKVTRVGSGRNPTPDAPGQVTIPLLVSVSLFIN